MPSKLPVKLASKLLPTSEETKRKFLDKIASAVSIIYEPTRITRKAKAEVDAELIHQGRPLGLSIKDTQYLNQLIYREKSRSKNFSKIIEKALPLISNDADPSGIEDDWLNLFFDKASRIKDEDMQLLWAHILAGETNSPSSFSRQTLYIVDQINKSSARAFSELASYKFTFDEDLVVFLYNFPKNDDGNVHSLNHDSLIQLESLGLLIINNNHNTLSTDNSIIDCQYFNHKAKLELQRINSNNHYITEPGRVALTLSGKELIRICQADEQESVWEDTVSSWRKQGIKIISNFVPTSILHQKS